MKHFKQKPFPAIRSSYRNAKIAFVAVAIVAISFGIKRAAATVHSNSFNFLGSGLQVAAGTQKAYDLNYKSIGQADLQATSTVFSTGTPKNVAAPNRQSIEGFLSGKFVTTVLKTEPNTITYAAVIYLNKTSLRIGDRDASDDLAAIGGKVWGFQLNTRGEVLGVDIPTELGSVGRNFIRKLVSASIVALPVDADLREIKPGSSPHWQTEERSLYGALIAAYEVTSYAAESLHINKTLTHKQGLTGSQALIAGQSSVKGSAQAVIDIPSYTSSSVHSWQEVTQLSGGHTVASNREEWSLQLVSTEQKDARSIAQLRQVQATTERATLSGDEEIERQRTLRYHQIIASSSLVSTLDDADAQRDLQSLSAVPSDLIERLKAHLTLTPDAPATLGKHLANAKSGGVPFKLYLSVLTANSSPAAQEVLRDTANSREDDQRAMYAILGSLAFLPNPDGETMAFLSDLAQRGKSQDTRRSSLLAYASAGNTRQNLDANDPIAAAVYNKVLSTFQAPSADFDRDLAIVALGNLGRAEQADILVPVLKSDPSASTRQLAVEALRFVGGNKTDLAETTILETLQQDEAPNVRAGAADALQFHGLTANAIRVLLEQLQKERSPIVLQAILKQISTASLDDAKARSSLIDFAASCGTHDICHYAQSLVAATPPPP